MVKVNVKKIIILINGTNDEIIEAELQDSKQNQMIMTARGKEKNVQKEIRTQK